MMWKKPEESAPKKAKVTISAGKVMAMENLKWEIFTHSPYSPELAPSDFHLYPALKWHLGGKHFANDDEVQAEANHWLRRQDTACHQKLSDVTYEVETFWKPARSTIYGISSCELEDKVKASYLLRLWSSFVVVIVSAKNMMMYPVDLSYGVRSCRLKLCGTAYSTLTSANSAKRVQFLFEWVRRVQFARLNRGSEPFKDLMLLLDEIIKQRINDPGLLLRCRLYFVKRSVTSPFHGPLQFREQEKVTGGQIWGIRWLRHH
ncbi:hypothetical protein LAZ67_3005811 [Cordylochernes scorpioides]|uniref:Transposase n=1 Tax=Cordylochernes scorpioides TaxID=51811 RepID=A0ABY6KAL3_9ARAC|nr:hypothetical protein LAZ67_3005811 [Cordylochernes scorpioides]